MSEYQQYRRRQVAELRPYVEGDDLTGVSISQPDKDAGSPKPGDMIARNPANHADMWLVAKAYFEANFEENFAPLTTPEATAGAPAEARAREIADRVLDALTGWFSDPKMGAKAWGIVRRHAAAARAALKEKNDGQG